MKHTANKKSLIVLAVVTIAVLLVLLVCIIRARVMIYSSHYDVTSDYRYNIAESNAYVVKLKMHDGRITLPEFDGSYSVFVKMHINSTLLGELLEPAITIVSKHQSAIQYFECGAEGIRYVNITPILAPNVSTVSFNTNDLVLDDQTVELIAYKNKDLKKERILIVSPHPDDAEIAAYGLYSSNRNSYIVTITAGDAGGNKYDEIYQDSVKQYLQKGKFRTWNSITVPMLGGISPEQTINLGFFDGTLASMFRKQSLQASGVHTHVKDISTYRRLNITSLRSGLHGGADWNSLVDNLVFLLKKIKPNIIVSPYPALDRHKDHKYASIALFEAIKRAGIKQGDLFLYTNHYVLNEYYPYGKMGSVVTLPPKFDRYTYFDRIYSHTLSKVVQKEKILVLDAMNDLRLDTEWHSSMGAVKLAVRNIKRDILGKNNSYYRRAVRSNELFFVIDINDIYDDEILNRIKGENNLFKKHKKKSVDG